MSEHPGAGPDPSAAPDPSAGPEPDGRWWDAEIVADASPAIASPGDDPVTNPYGCGDLWERYRIRWILDEPPPDGVPIEQEVSPWEMYRGNTTTASALLEEPSCVPRADAERLSACLHAARRASRWRLFSRAPGPDDCWEGEEGEMRAYNKVVPLPMGLDILQVRHGEKGLRFDG
jgi:hypothetical protein